MKPGEHRVIESAHNELFKTLKRLVGTKGIRQHRMAMFCGSRVVSETLARHPERCVAVVTAKSRDVTFSTPPPRHLSEYQVPPTLFRELDVLGTAYPLLLVKAPPLPRWDPTETPPPGCTLLIPFQDPENVGSVIRSGVGLGAKRVVLLAEAAHPYHPKTVRAAGGLVLDAELLRGPSLADMPDTLPAIPLSTRGKPLRDFVYPESFYLLPGLEGPGLPAKWRANAVTIPTQPGVDSLNAAVATGIALYDWAGKTGGPKAEAPEDPPGYLITASLPRKRRITPVCPV